MTLFVQYFIPCKQLYMFHPKHVELFAGNKIQGDHKNTP
jgi:hypothetical protein